MENLAGANGVSAILQFFEQRPVRNQPVVAYMDQQKANLEGLKLELAFQGAVNCDENVEVILREGKQGAIPGTAPADLGHRPHRVTWECTTHAGVHTFI